MVNKKIKIAIVTDAIYPYNLGGKEKRIYEISTRLAMAGNDVHIYCMKWWAGENRHRIEGNVHLHAISKLYPLYSGQRRSFLQAIFFAFSCFKLIREDYDIIDADHMPHLVLFSIKIVSLIKNKKLYVTWNEVWGRAYWVEYLGQLGNIAYIVEWLSSRFPNKIIAVSDHTRNKLVNDLKVKKEIIVIPNGIDLKLIQKVKPAREKSDIIFVGRLLKHKNVDVLIQSIRLLKKDVSKIKVFIIGDGPEKENLQKLTKKLHLENNIKFLGFLKTQRMIYSFMKSSKIFLFLSNREGFGIAALEANACGLPVITSNNSNNATKDLIIDGKNGFSCALRKKILIRKIKILLEKKFTEKDFFNLIKLYDWKNISIQTENFYKSI